MTDGIDIQSALSQARQFSQKKQSDAAVKMVNTALHINPQSIEAHHLNIEIVLHHPDAKGGISGASLLARARTSVAALELFEPSNPKTYEAAARVEVLARDHKAAGVAAMKAIALDPHRPDAHEILGELYKHSKVKISPDHVHLDPSLPPGSMGYLVHRARTFAHYGLGDDAIESVNQALTLDPTSTAAHLANINVIEKHPERTNALRKDALLSRARKSSAALLHYGAEDASSHEGAARVHFMAREFGAAADAAQRCLAIDPERTTAHKLVGDCHKYLGNQEEAVAAYVSAAESGDEVSAAPIVNSFHSKALVVSAPPFLALLYFGRRIFRVIPGEVLIGVTAIGLIGLVAIAVASGVRSDRRQRLVDERLGSQKAAA